MGRRKLRTLEAFAKFKRKKLVDDPSTLLNTFLGLHMLLYIYQFLPAHLFVTGQHLGISSKKILARNVIRKSSDRG